MNVNHKSLDKQERKFRQKRSRESLNEDEFNFDEPLIKKRKLNEPSNDTFNPKKSSENKNKSGDDLACIICNNSTENCIKPWIECIECKKRVNIYCSFMIKNQNITIYNENKFQCIICKMKHVINHKKYHKKQEKYKNNPSKYELNVVLYVASIDQYLMKWEKISELKQNKNKNKQFVIERDNIFNENEFFKFCWRKESELTSKQRKLGQNCKSLYSSHNETILHSLKKQKIKLNQEQINKINDKTHSCIKPKIRRYKYRLNGEYFGITTLDKIFTKKELEWITKCMIKRSNVSINDDIIRQYPEAFDIIKSKKVDRVKVYHEYGYSYGSTQTPQKLPINNEQNKKDENTNVNNHKKGNVLYKTRLKMDSLKCSEFIIERIKTVMIDSGLYNDYDINEFDQLQINRYGKLTGIGNHFDECLWFKFPIITLRLENESALHFGVRQRKLRNDSLKIDLNIGTVLIMESWAAMKYKHCVQNKEHQNDHSISVIIRSIRQNAVQKCPNHLKTRYLKKEKE